MLCFFNVFAIFLKVKGVDCQAPFLYDRESRPSCLKNLNFRFFSNVSCFNQLTYYAEYKCRPESSIAVLQGTQTGQYSYSLPDRETVIFARAMHTDFTVLILLYILFSVCYYI